MTSKDFERILQNRIPQNSIAYCVSLFTAHPFRFKLSRNRKSKSGDFRYDKRSNISTVTVNTGLNRYSFLITLIHEIAHHHTRIRYTKSIKPHGPEWKAEFKRLMLPVLNTIVFPEDLVRLLARHLKNPRASTWSDPQLSKALRKFNAIPPKTDEYHLDDILDGNSFIFNERAFRKLEKRRTRILCRDHSTGRKYLIPGQAVVKIIAK